MDYEWEEGGGVISAKFLINQIIIIITFKIKNENGVSWINWRSDCRDWSNYYEWTMNEKKGEGW